MPFVDVDQLSVDWLKMRCGCVTASHMADVVAKLKRKEGEAAARYNYKRKKVAEYLTGMSMDTYVSRYMEDGQEREPLARTAYEIQRDCEVMPGGLFVHDAIPKFMASPDGRVGSDGLLEIKCLTDHEHLEIITTGEIPEEYQWQMHGQLSCATGYKWVDFCAFNPYMPKHLRLWVKRFPRDEKMISAVELETVQFLEEMIAMLKKLEPQRHPVTSASQAIAEVAG